MAGLDYVCVDVDGVLLDMMSGLRKYLWKTRKIRLHPDSITAYDFDQCNLGFDYRVIYQCFEEVELYHMLEVFPDALDGLNKLKRVVRVVPYTCVPAVESVFNQRAKFIRRHFGFGEPVRGFRKPVDMGAIALFDDCVNNHKLWISNGSRARKYLVHSLCNRYDNSLEGYAVRCKSFKAAVDLFCKEYSEHKKAQRRMQGAMLARV